MARHGFGSARSHSPGKPRRPQLSFPNNNFARLRRASARAFGRNATMPATLTPFSYAQLTPAVAELVRGKTEEIRRSAPRMLDAAIAIGKALIAVRDALPHGQFLPWLGAEFSWSARTAERYMAASMAFEGKSDTVSHLTLGTIYALAAPANEAARRTVADRVGRGDRPSETEVRTMIGASREVRTLEREEAARARARRREEASWDRQRRAQSSPQAKARVTRAQKRAEAATRREQQQNERDRQTAQEATELLLSLLPEDGLHRLVSLFNNAGALPGHFAPTFFGALKNRLLNLGWNGHEARLLHLTVKDATVRIEAPVPPTDKGGDDNVVPFRP
jgi:hypothetical protein